MTNINTNDAFKGDIVAKKELFSPFFAVLSGFFASKSKMAAYTVNGR